MSGGPPRDRRSAALRAHLRRLRTDLGGLGPRRVVPFVILTTPRSGSEALVRMLDSHDHIRCDSEILDRRVRLAHRFLAGRGAAAARLGARAYGFKLMSHHISWYHDEGLLDRLWLQGWQFVHLVRADLLAQALSALEGRDRVYHQRAGERTFEPIQVDPVDLITYLNNQETYQQLNDRRLADIPHRTVVYERDLRDPARRDETVASIVDDLGLQSEPLGTDLVPVAPREALDRVANRDEVVTALSATRYRSLVLDAD